MGDKKKLWFAMPFDGIQKEFHFRACVCGEYVDIRKNGEVTVTDAQAAVLLKEYPQWVTASKPKAEKEAEEKAATPPAENKAVKPPKSNR